MARHASRRLILVAPLILFSFPASIIAQDSVSTPKPVAGPTETTPRSGPDPEMEAISKAEQEGRLLDAEKLLVAAVHKEELSFSADRRLVFLLSRLGRVEFQLGRYPEAVIAVKHALAVNRTEHGGQFSAVLFDLRNVAYYSYRAGDRAAADQAIDEGVALGRKDPGPLDANLLMALRQATVFDEMHQSSAQADALRAESAGICKAQTKSRASICSVILLDFYRKNGDLDSAQKILSEQAAKGPVDYHGHADYGRQLNALGQLAVYYQQESSYDRAESTYQKAIAVAENHIPNPLIAPGVYYQFGRLLELEGKNEEAEAAYKHAFEALENMQGRFRFVAIGRLSDTPLVRLYEKEGRTSEAEAILERTLAAQEQALNPHDEHLARTLMQLADLKMRQGEYSVAGPLCERALKIQEADFGPENPQLIQTLSLYAAVERQLHNSEKADALAARATALRHKTMPESLPRPR